MNIGECLRILELTAIPSPEEAHRAYRDLVRVWHPDRFSEDPRLRKKAEDKVKELNVAYEGLMHHLAHGDSRGGRSEAEDASREEPPLSHTEAAFEYGTRKVLTFWHSLSQAFKAAAKEARTENRDGKPHS